MRSFALNPSMSMRPAVVPPSAWTGHLPFAFWVVEEARPRTLVELGSHHGTSYLAFCQSVVRCGYDTRCFAVDTWQGDEHSGFYGDEDRRYGFEASALVTENAVDRVSEVTSLSAGSAPP